jgi:hypothetical protein
MFRYDNMGKYFSRMHFLGLSRHRISDIV